MDERLRELNEELSELNGRLARANGLERRLDDLRAQYEERKARVEETARLLTKEREDVEKLERGGLRALLLSLTGDREARLSQERREELAARLQYDQARRDAGIWRSGFGICSRSGRSCGPSGHGWKLCWERKRSA
ncbi:MAG: hypothetical protein ACLR28_12345 [Flavonifractor plautii]